LTGTLSKPYRAGNSDPPYETANPWILKQSFEFRFIFASLNSGPLLL
jgi:hypothetical protein